METIRDRLFKFMMEQSNRGEELQRALLTTAQTALLPYDLDPILHEELLNLQPLADLLQIIEAKGKTHEYNVRSTHPQAWFEGETTPMAQTSGTYARKSVQQKIQRIWGGVTGFAQAMDEAFIDALSTELQGSLEGMADIMEYGCMWGCADDIGFTGDAYQYSGIIPRLFMYAPGNCIDAGGNKIVLDDLDAVNAKACRFRGIRSDPFLWLMGTRMRQIIDGLQAKVQIPLTSVILEDGRWEMAAYDGIPILETDFLATVSGSTTSPTVTATKGAGGALADDEYFYAISSVTIYGEQVHGTENSATTETTNNTVNLTWTADAKAKSYMIWRGLTTGGANMKLLDIVAALTYDAAGTVNGSVEAYADAGARDTGSGALLQNLQPLEDGEENLLLVNRNPVRGVAFTGKVDDMGRTVDRLFSYVELARVKDTYDYMLKGYLALRLVHPNLVGCVRHAKLA